MSSERRAPCRRRRWRRPRAALHRLWGIPRAAARRGGPRGGALAPPRAAARQVRFLLACWLLHALPLGRRRTHGARVARVAPKRPNWRRLVWLPQSGGVPCAEEGSLPGSTNRGSCSLALIRMTSALLLECVAVKASLTALWWFAVAFARHAVARAAKGSHVRCATYVRAPRRAWLPGIAPRRPKLSHSTQRLTRAVFVRSALLLLLRLLLLLPLLLLYQAAGRLRGPTPIWRLRSRSCARGSRIRRARCATRKRRCAARRRRWTATGAAGVARVTTRPAMAARAASPSHCLRPPCWR